MAVYDTTKTSHRLKDLTGRRFGIISVLHRVHPRGKSRKAYWMCRCDCGIEFEVRGSCLTRGIQTSCGCERYKNGRRRHGLSGKSILNVHRNMMSRCYNEGDQAFKYYGARGIVVCERWHRIEHFLEDMGHPSGGYSIERIDNDGNYDPGNCKWIPRTDQSRNTRQNRLVTINGVTKLLYDWLRETGRNHRTFYDRVDRQKMSDADAITVPLKR